MTATDRALSLSISLSKLEPQASYERLVGPDRTRKAVELRACIQYRLRQEGFTLWDIAEATGRRHSAVINAIRLVDDSLKGYGDRGFARLYARFEALLNKDEESTALDAETVKTALETAYSEGRIGHLGMQWLKSQLGLNV